MGIFDQDLDDDDEGRRKIILILIFVQYCEAVKRSQIDLRRLDSKSIEKAAFQHLVIDKISGAKLTLPRY